MGSREPPVVLIVEDEPLLRMAAAGMVEEAGFVCVDARNADEAVAILASRPDIRIVFSDIDMPGSMDGMKLAAAIRDRWPPVGVILTSGHAKPVALPVENAFFSKPYVTSAVVATMRKMAGEDAPPLQ